MIFFGRTNKHKQKSFPRGDFSPQKIIFPIRARPLLYSIVDIFIYLFYIFCYVHCRPFLCVADRGFDIEHMCVLF